MLDLDTRGDFARHRRLRSSPGLRRLVAETRLSPSDFVYPLFVTHGQGVREEISSMPGQYQISLDQIGREADDLRALGIPAVLLFGLPAMKDEQGSEAYDDGGIVQDAVRAFKEAAPELVVITDVCLCEYTSHGHCGVIVDGDVDNDRSLELLARTALSHARAGADMVAPSDMMDGRVAAIRDDAGRRGLHADADHGVQREVRVGVLRAVPGGGGQRAAVRRPARLPDGPAERARGAGGDRGRHRRGRGHRDGEAGAGVPRRAVEGARRSSTCRSRPTT